MTSYIYSCRVHFRLQSVKQVLTITKALYKMDLQITMIGFMFTFISFRRNINHLLSELLNLGNKVYYLDLSIGIVNISLQRLTFTP